MIYSLLLLPFVFIILPCACTLISKKEFTKLPIICRFVNRLTLDIIAKNPPRIHGFTLFCGKQGGGKTYCAVSYAYDICKKYGATLLSNTPLTPPSEIPYLLIKSINDIIYLPPAPCYVIFLDEIQTLFDTKNFNDDFYTIFCQLRKRNIKLIGTAQVFERCALKLREQVNELYYCRTFFGCLTRRRQYIPALDKSGKLSTVNIVRANTHFIVQCDLIRKMYDTYYKI